MRKGACIGFVLLALQLLPKDRPEESLSLSPPVHLPDGSEFKTWDNRTDWTKTYMVDQNHPSASDANPGTAANPFLTIQRAAQVLRPGERVVVKSGVYREQITPRAGGTTPDRMIGYEAAPGARVIVKGSRVLPPAWTRSRNPQECSEKLWMIRLEPDYFPAENPFAILNADSADLDIMPWAHEWTGRLPFALRRGMVFQAGRRLAQLGEYADLLYRPGSFWVDPGGLALHIHPFDGADPNRMEMEITVHQHLFKPAETGLGYIRIAGFTFMHAGNGYPRTGVGAVFAMGGHHWLIENNTVCQVNSVGIEIGTRSIESADERIDRSDEERARRSPGRNIVRKNRIFECGRGGIQGLEVRRALVENNWIHDCGWWDVERLWETGGIKLLVNEKTLVQGNRIERITGGPAVWLDWNNRHCRITRNLVYDTESCCNGALFVEASRRPNWIDHNILWNVKGTGVFAGDTDSLVVAHNLIGPCTGPAVRAFAMTDRRLDGRPMTARGNRVWNNILMSAEPIRFVDPENESDGNVFSDPAFDLAAWRQTGRDLQGLRMNLRCVFEPGKTELLWDPDSLLPQRRRVLMDGYDFFGVSGTGDSDVPGPFADRFAKPVILDLNPLKFGGL
jgi:hypothetical protein